MSAPIGLSAPPLVPVSAAPEEDEDEDLLALLRQQEEKEAAERQRLAQQAQAQQGGAARLRTLGLLTGMGTNPLLQGFSQNALGQASAIEANAAQRLRGIGKPPPSNDPASEASKRLQVQIKALRPDLPDEVIGTITEANASRFMREAMTAAGITQRAASSEATNDQRTKDREQRGEQFADMMGYRWASLNQAQRLAFMRLADATTARGDKDESGLRKEFMGNKVVKDYFDAAIAFEKVQNAANDPSAAGDLALIFGVMKTLDPGSTVREGEFANAENAKGVPDAVRAKWNKVLSGERLTAEQRADFVRTAQGQLGAHESAYNRFAQTYRGLAPPGAADRVVPSIAPPTKSANPLRRVAPTQALPRDASGTPTLDAPAPSERREYSRKLNKTRVLDASGAVLRVEDGDTRGR